MQDKQSAQRGIDGPKQIISLVNTELICDSLFN